MDHYLLTNSVPYNTVMSGDNVKAYKVYLTEKVKGQGTFKIVKTMCSLPI